MTSSTFTPLFAADDAPRERGAKRYDVYDLTTTIAAMGVTGYFNKYDLRGANVGDFVWGTAADGVCLYEITGEDNTNGNKILTLRFSGAVETPITVGAGSNGVVLTAGGAGNGHTGLDVAVTPATLATALAADPAAVTALANAIWTSFIGTKFVWDGTKLDIDYNDNGNPTA